MSIKSVILILALVTTRGSFSWGADIHTPPPGSSERRVIIDVMRSGYYRDAASARRNANGILLYVRYMKVQGDWALVCVDPVKSGKIVGESNWELLRRKGAQWRSVDYFAAIAPLASPEDPLDNLDMTPSTIRKIRQKFPDVPKGIFPREKLKEPPLPFI